jgi:hypothetical protein
MFSHLALRGSPWPAAHRLVLPAERLVVRDQLLRSFGDFVVDHPTLAHLISICLAASLRSFGLSAARKTRTALAIAAGAAEESIFVVDRLLKRSRRQ